MGYHSNRMEFSKSWLRNEGYQKLQSTEESKALTVSLSSLFIIYLHLFIISHTKNM